MATKTFRSGVITLDDGTHTFTFDFDGEFKLEIPGVDVIILTDRGALPATPELVKGNEKPMSASLSCNWRTLHSAGAETPSDFFMAENGAGYVGANWTSTTSATGTGVFTVNMTYSDGSNSFKLTDCIIRGDVQEGEYNKINAKIQCPHAYPTTLA